nr:hypothetical protein [Halomicroarcula sp. SYNS111]
MRLEFTLGAAEPFATQASYFLDKFEGLTRDDVLMGIDSVTSKSGDMTVITASVELHEHTESSRGVPTVLARIRLVIDRGYFTADGEGYGATHALRLAANAIERQLLKSKAYGQSKKHPNPDGREQPYGWWLGA